MAKGAATSKTMAGLHAKMAVILTKVLEGYEAKLDALDTIKRDREEELGNEMLVELMEQNFEPSPAVLAVIAKFLKDNSIEFEAEEINELSALEKRLEAKKASRPNLATVTTLPVMGNG